MLTRRVARSSFEGFLAGAVGVWPKLTPAQRVLVRVAFDDLDPCQLSTQAERDIAAELFGPVESVPPRARRVLALLKGARVGGTWLSSLYLLHRMLSARLDSLAAGEMASVVAVGPDLRLARLSLSYVKGALKASPALSASIVAETSDSVTLRRPDGRLARLEALPAAAGGRATRGRGWLAALLDEASFFRDAETGAVNDLDVYRSIVARLVPGGKMVVCSTAWIASGLLHNLVEKNHGQPESALAVVATTPLMRAGDDNITELVQSEMERDELSARREFLCEVLPSGAGQFFATEDVRAAVDDSIELRASLPDGAIGCVGGDVGLVHDSSAGVAIHRRAPDDLRVAELFELRPKRGSPLSLERVCGELSALAVRHRATAVTVDHHMLSEARRHMIDGVRLVAAPGGQAGKVESYMVCRDLLRAGKLRIPRGGTGRLVQQLSEVVSIPLPGGGVSIRVPRRAGSHGDLLSAFVLSAWAARQAAGTAMDRAYVNAMKATRERLGLPVLDLGNYAGGDQLEVNEVEGTVRIVRRARTNPFRNHGTF